MKRKKVSKLWNICHWCKKYNTLFLNVYIYSKLLVNIIFTFCFRKIFSKGPYNSSAAALAECDILIIIISCNLLKANFFIHFYFDQHHFLIRFFYFDKTKFIFLMLNLHLAFIHFLVNFIWFLILKLLFIITITISVSLIVVFLIFFSFVPLSDSATYSLTQITYCFNFGDFFNSMQIYVIYSWDRYFAL